jgi:hypothetical protein
MFCRVGDPDATVSMMAMVQHLQSLGALNARLPGVEMDDRPSHGRGTWKGYLMCRLTYIPMGTPHKPHDLGFVRSAQWNVFDSAGKISLPRATTILEAGPSR